MPNCDWNKPCDCRDCREIIETHICPSCQFKNKVSIERMAQWVNDQKHGGGHYVFEVPSSPIKDLDCYNCGYRMEKVGYFTSVHEVFCQWEKERSDLIQAGRFCVKCNKIEGKDFGFSKRVKLRDFNGQIMCEECIVESFKLVNPDPSDTANKYRFDQEKLEWILVRVKLACVSCGESHWVNANERGWRKQCKPCYSSR